MWCNNCLLLFPLRAGAQALAAFILAYSLAGAIFLFRYGAFFYFMTYEAKAYGSLSFFIAVIAAFHIIAYANSSCKNHSPFLIVIVALRAGLMTFRLNAYRSNVTWECLHGGQEYNSTIATLAEDQNYNWTAAAGTTAIPSTFCKTGWNTVYLAFAFGLGIDMLFQIYQYFMIWRFKASLFEYFAFKRNEGG
ncbi:BQ2448_3802 [Microbotryum intermedium]|uniref:BQ2448_3802 protein n=1 Tax=Microbotryum intermedium TaxID=269621 RepID=A0A238FB12_9BASI|nr:BQ2448_3802 [Microbotryum intermedium]